MDNVTLYDELVKSWGVQFQEKFSELMKCMYGSDYQPTSTNGQDGDRAVDGVLHQNTAFAVYAPEVYSNEKTIKKIISDFEKFIALRSVGHWSTIIKYVFVIKFHRSGMTAAVIDTIATLGERFPTELMTLEDLKNLSSSYLPFSDDEKMMEMFKCDLSVIGEYIVKTDFSAEPIRLEFPDELYVFIEKWSSVKRIFKNGFYENTKKSVLELFIMLSEYMSEDYIHPNVDNSFLVFKADNRDQIVFKMRPNIKCIRAKLSSIMTDLFYGGNNLSY